MIRHLKDDSFFEHPGDVAAIIEDLSTDDGVKGTIQNYLETPACTIKTSTEQLEILVTKLLMENHISKEDAQKIRNRGMRFHEKPAIGN